MSIRPIARLGEALAAEAIAASGSFTLHDGPVEQFSALRFLLAFGGSGTPAVRIQWKAEAGTNIGTVETVTLSSNYNETPVRHTHATITIVETGGANGITATGGVVGVARA